MKKAKIIPNGNSQAVRLPKECRFSENEVFAKKIGNVVLLIPKDDPWAAFNESFNFFSSDFFEEERVQPEFDKRESL